MLHLRMGMPLYLMAFYGSIMILAVLILRSLLKNRLPKPVFPILWALVLIRLLIPFSLSSPLSGPVPLLSIMNRDNEAAAMATATAGTLAIEAPAAESAVLQDTAVTETLVTESSGSEALTLENSGSETLAQGTAQTVSYGSRFPKVSLINLLEFILYAGIALTLFMLLYRKWLYSRKLRDSLLVEHNETINGILRSMNFGHVLVFTNDHIASPLVTGILNSRIYLPAGMEFQNTQLLKDIFAHETMHIRRRDNLFKTGMLFVLCLHWYNPLVWIMSRYLSADMEAACDAAVLKNRNEEERRNYAYSLLAMAITGNRQTLLYSAFSKTEVERRIQSVLHYKKATALMLAFSAFLLFGSTIVFATGGQAPFSKYLSSYCGSSDSQWAVKAVLTRDIALGDNPTRRADNVILSVMKTEAAKDPDVLRKQAAAGLAEEFGVEKGAFRITVQLSLDEQTLESQYLEYGITKDKNGLYVYKGEPARIYRDEMPGRLQIRDGGTVDIKVIRDRLGKITAITAWHKGEPEFDSESLEISGKHLDLGVASENSSTAAKKDTAVNIP